MGLRSSAIKMTGKGFDIERRIKESPFTSVVLLRRDHASATAVPYSVLKTYTAGFILRYSTFRNQTEIEIATEDDLQVDVTKLMGIALMVGNTGKICMISNGDIVPPDDERFTWLFFGTIKVAEIYTVV